MPLPANVERAAVVARAVREGAGRRFSRLGLWSAVHRLGPLWSWVAERDGLPVDRGLGRLLERQAEEFRRRAALVEEAAARLGEDFPGAVALGGLAVFLSRLYPEAYLRVPGDLDLWWQGDGQRPSPVEGLRLDLHRTPGRFAFPFDERYLPAGWCEGLAGVLGEGAVKRSGLSVPAGPSLLVLQALHFLVRHGGRDPHSLVDCLLLEQELEKAQELAEEAGVAGLFAPAAELFRVLAGRGGRLPRVVGRLFRMGWPAGSLCYLLSVRGAGRLRLLGGLFSAALRRPGVAIRRLGRRGC